MKLLVTGGAGFIGSNFIRYILETYPEDSVVNFDKLTYAGNLDNLKDVVERFGSRYTFAKGDIVDRDAVFAVAKDADAIVNFAAESHVDRSIEGGADFIRTDVLGTFVLLNAAREFSHSRYVQISTDEVYGDIPAGKFSKETDMLHPSSPYSASKAGGDLQVLAFHRTHKIPGLITRCTNNYGPYQHPEKLIPLFITNAMLGKPLPVYGDGGQVRDWLHVMDHCRGIDLVLRKGTIGEIYNIGANQPEVTNLMITKGILEAFGKDESLIVHIDDRKGHDRRYAVDTAKIQALGWQPQADFASGFAQTIDWYRGNEWWWKAIRNSQFEAYYAGQYSKTGHGR